MFDQKIIRTNAIVLLIVSVPLIIVGFGWIGLFAFILGTVNLPTGLIFLLTRRKKQGLTFLFCSGILLLIGFSICSVSPFGH